VLGREAASDKGEEVLEGAIVEFAPELLALIIGYGDTGYYLLITWLCQMGVFESVYEVDGTRIYNV
jgi:hypothetical protein